MSAHTSGIQRMIQLFWDRNLENTDLINPICVQGKEYKPDSAMEKKQDLREATYQEEHEDNKSVDNPFDEIKNYFQSFTFINEAQKKLETSNAPWPKDFIEEVRSKLWFTYRTQFKPLVRDLDGPSPLSLKNLLRGQTNELNNDHFTTDCGWGCMIRTSQTLLANTLVKLKMDSNWQFVPQSEDSDHEEIVKWFVDSPTQPFSIHKIVEKGKLLSGKRAGEWFGPSAAARSIQSLTSEFDCGLNVYIGSDAGDIYEKDLYRIFKQNNDDFRPTLILLGVRLGVDNINSIYWDSLKNILGSTESCGISGGRPSSSHYFFGYQGDYLFYLDPHFPQPSLELEEETGVVNSIDSVHTEKIRKIHISEVDPSMLIGILIKSEDEWDAWKSKIQDQENKNTIIHISPDHVNSEMLNRKPSFVVYNEDGDDFVDVGYEDLIEEDQDVNNQEGEEDYEMPDSSQLINDKEQDTSIISVSESEVLQISTVSRKSEVLGDTSFEQFTTEKKDNDVLEHDIENNQFDNIESSVEDEDTTTVEVESIREEEPYVIDKTDINSPLESEEIIITKEESEIPCQGT